jgi:putative methyltransferase (TIGR04325 family)
MPDAAAIRRVASLFLPPIATHVARRLRQRLTGGGALAEQAAEMPMRALAKPEWEYLPGGWSHSDPDVKGWNVESVVAMQCAKWPDFLRSVEGTGPFGVAHEGNPSERYSASAHNTVMSFGYVLGRAGAARGRLSVLDWGGGVGNYYVFARALWPDCAFEYTCKDLPLMAAAGRGLLPDCRFEDDDDRALAGRYDLVMSSSSLQYSRDWQALVGRLCAAATGYLYVTRLPVVETAPSFVVVQRPYTYGYGTEYLGWFINRRELVDAVERNGFRLVREFVVDEQPTVPNAPEQCRYGGFLFKRITPGPA